MHGLLRLWSPCPPARGSLLQHVMSPLASDPGSSCMASRPDCPVALAPPARLQRWMATEGQIKSAYRKAALIHHPDKQVGGWLMRLNSGPAK